MKTFSYIFLISILLSIFGNVANAAPKNKKTLSAEEVLLKGREAFLNYDFEEAEELYEQYRAMKTKARQNPDEVLDLYETQLNIAINAFDRVQKIEIIDSIAVPRGAFFEAYKLSPSAGKIGMTDSFKLKTGVESSEISFLNEDSDLLITAVPDSLGNLKLVESRHLLDGTWETQDVFNEEFETDGNYVFPFLHGDGQTFYFANDGEESMGGYDIFVAQKTPITGEFLQPLNIGMPFNSPFDDFMMAIDEESGLGWWATDRHSPGGDLTVYVFKIDEVRKNYSPDTENLKKYARIDSYKNY